MDTSLAIQIINSLMTVVGLVIAIMQLRRILRSVRISQQGNSVNVIVHCVNRYEKIMSELPSSCKDRNRLDNWYYRYWDFATEEFSFFKKSILDPDIYELWINELTASYQSAPDSRLRPRVDSHHEYLRTRVSHYKELHAFFGRVEGISTEASAETRAALVHKLIKDFAPAQ
jgi:hypothetical protein